MFLCATSADNRNDMVVDDFAAVFSTNLQEPILLDHFTIELVSAIITCKKNIKIEDVNNKIAIRVGNESVAEQYLIKIPVGTYTTDEMSDILVEKILDVIPVKGWVVNTGGDKFVSCVYDKTGTPHKFVLTFTKLATNDEVIKKYMIKENLNTYGFPLEYGASTDIQQALSFVNYNSQEKNNEPIFSQGGGWREDLDIPNKSGSIVGLDVGKGLNGRGADPGDYVRDLGYAGWKNVGIAENDGKFEVEIKPQRCSIETNYNKNIGADDVNTAPYFVIVDNTKDTPYDSMVWDRALLNPNSKTTIRTDANNNRYVSGILVAQPADLLPNSQGGPYNKRPAVMAFPPNESAGYDGAGELTTNAYRQEKIRSTWNNSFRMMGNTKTQQGTDGNINSYNHFSNRGFNLEINETDPANPTNPGSKAQSSLALFKNLNNNPNTNSYELYEKEGLSFHLATAPLIQGLPQTRLAAGDIVQSYIVKGGTTAEDILVNVAPVPATFVMKYKVGSIGQFNSTSFGANATKNTNGSGGSNRRLPYYKITKVDADFQPEKLVLVDGGENILAGQTLVLNDPNTFDIIDNTAGLTEQAIVDTYCAVVTPLAANIGATTNTYTTRFQYLPTTISLTNDMIFSAGMGVGNNQKFAVTTGGQTMGADFSKDIQLSIIPMDSAAASQPNSIRFQVKGFTPQETTFDTEDEMYEKFTYEPEATYDMEQVFFDASPANWSSSVTYDSGGRTLTDWTGFVQNNAASKIKLLLKLNNFFEFSAFVQFWNFTTAAWEGGSTLINTFEAATINGTTYPTLECTAKTRLYPYHIGINSVPGTNYTNPLCQGNNEMTILGTRLADYKLSPKDLKVSVSHYERNLRNLLQNTDNYPSIFVFPTAQATIGGANLDKPPIMLKFGNNIDPTAAPAFSTNNKLPPNDIAPTGTNYINNCTGFASSYIANSSEWGATTLAVEGETASEELPSINTFAVELENIPAKGYITEGYTNQGFKKGRGVSSAIVGVVPRLEERTLASDSQNYVRLGYNATYSQPVEVKLPTPTFMYNFNFRLRDITSNTYLKNLLNPTELIFRIQKMLS